MIDTEQISTWLDEPHQLKDIDPEAIHQLSSEFPYFSPAQYLLFIGGNLKSDAIFQLQQTHPVNAVLLSQLIKAFDTKPFIESLRQKDALNWMQPVSGEDYLLQQGIHVSNDFPEFSSLETEDEKALMVVMSFAEWLKHISSKNKKAKEEVADQKALKMMWQQQKLAAANDEESDEIPEQVFEMAVNSIARKEELLSESLANVYAKQGKKGKAIEMYQKLSLLNPEKKPYFAAKIENLQKEI